MPALPEKKCTIERGRRDISRHDSHSLSSLLCPLEQVNRNEKERREATSPPSRLFEENRDVTLLTQSCPSPPETRPSAGDTDVRGCPGVCSVLFNASAMSFCEIQISGSEPPLRKKQFSETFRPRYVVRHHDVRPYDGQAKITSVGVFRGEPSEISRLATPKIGAVPRQRTRGLP